MTIRFESFKEHNYVLATWTGTLSSSEIIGYYKTFYESPEWVAGMNELVDVSLFSFENVSSQGLRDISKFGESIYKKNNITNFKTACYCPRDVQKGMVHAFSIWADESPEIVKIFKDLGTAKDWLLDNKN